MSRRDWIDPEQMSEMRPVSFAARDGMTLHGYVTLPKGVGDKHLPMVVLPHGGPFGVAEAWKFNDESQLLASAGYAVLQVDFRGSGQYGRAFQQAGARQWGGAMQDDITDATKWAIAQQVADPQRICIYGASYGAYASLMGAARKPTLYKCAAGYVGVYDLPLMVSMARTRPIPARRGHDSGSAIRHSCCPTPPCTWPARSRSRSLLAAGGQDKVARSSTASGWKGVARGERAGGDAVFPHRRPRLLRRRTPAGVLHAVAGIPQSQHRWRGTGTGGGGDERGSARDALKANIWWR